MNPNIRVGTVEGTGAAINVELGFVPDVVEVVNIDATNPVSIKWTSDMADAAGIKLTGGATPAHTKISSNGISAYAGSRGAKAKGFTIGADTGLNVNGETITYVAMRSGAGAE